jgi:hypothetical protein
MREERSWMFQEVWIMKTKTFKSSTNMEESTNNGQSFMQINIQTSLSKVNLILISAFMLREISMLFQS